MSLQHTHHIFFFFTSTCVTSVCLMLRHLFIITISKDGDCIFPPASPLFWSDSLRLPEINLLCLVWEMTDLCVRWPRLSFLLLYSPSLNGLSCQLDSPSEIFNIQPEVYQAAVCQMVSEGFTLGLLQLSLSRYVFEDVFMPSVIPWGCFTLTLMTHWGERVNI